MQKKLLTVAVAGALSAPGLALAQVEVYGFVNMSAGRFNYSGGAASEPRVSKWDVASHASNYGIRGRENVGGGQTAWFQIEQNAPMERSNNTAITPASRNSAVGLQGAWGNLFMGQWTTPWADLDALWGVGTVGGWGPITSIIGRRETTGTAPNPNCANAGHGNPASCDAVEAGGGVGHAFWRRVSQAVFYQSPVMGGAQVKLAYQTNEGKSSSNATTNGDPQLWSTSVQWAGMGGRLRVGAAYDQHKDFTTLGQTDRGWRATGGWNFGVVDVGVAYEEMVYKPTGGECEARQWGIGLAVPIGMGAIRGSYAKADELESSGTVNCAAIAGNPGNGGGGAAKTWNVGYEHRFSKRSSVGVGYAIIRNDGVAAFTWTGVPPNQNGVTNGPVPGGDVSTYFVNMVHRF